MKKLFLNPCLLVFSLAMIAAPSELAAQDREKLIDRALWAEESFVRLMSNPDTAVPREILREAVAVIIMPQTKGAFLIGGRGGTGLIIAKNRATGEWGNPCFINMRESSLGFQAGFQRIDTIYAIMDYDTVHSLFGTRFRVGTDAQAVAGPRVTDRGSELDPDVPILVYSNAAGLYAGAVIRGGYFSPNQKATQAFYNTRYQIPEILLADWVDTPSEMRSLVSRLRSNSR